MALAMGGAQRWLEEHAAKPRDPRARVPTQGDNESAGCLQVCGAKSAIHGHHAPVVSPVLTSFQHKDSQGQANAVQNAHRKRQHHKYTR